MPRWAKVLIIIVIVVVLGIVGVVGAGVFWWSRNKDALIAKGKAVVQEGTDAGHQTDNQGCVDGALERYRKEPGFTNGISTSVFLQSCLKASRPTPGFCDAVPAKTEFVKTAEWQLGQCRAAGLGEDQYCRQIFSSVQKYCEERTAESGS